MTFTKVLFTALVASVFLCYCNAQVPKFSVGSGGAFASFGGYHASAGLGGLAGGSGARGGLFAQAGTPDGTGAAAGLGGRAGGDAAANGGLYAGARLGGSAEAGAGAGSQGTVYKPTYYHVNTVKQVRPTLFDDIFNIPTSVLRSVNQFLNNNVRHGGKVVQANLNVAANTGASAGSTGGYTVVKATKPATTVVVADAPKIHADVHLDARIGVPPKEVVATKEVASSVSAASVSGTASKNYNGIFNIPITALRSVNNLLNNLG